MVVSCAAARWTAVAAARIATKAVKDERAMARELLREEKESEREKCDAMR